MAKSGSVRLKTIDGLYKAAWWPEMIYKESREIKEVGREQAAAKWPCFIN